MDIIKELREMEDTIANEIAEANQRIRQSGGDMNTGDVEIIDKLTHSMKSLATTIAMMEAEKGGYSGRDDRDGGVSGRYGRTDGHYAGRMTRGYSRTGEMMDHLRDLLDEAPDEMTRMEIKKLMDKMSGR